MAKTRKKPMAIKFRRVRPPKVPRGSELCRWQGYGFGAAYEDAGCVNGKASDLDNCDDRNLVAIGDEDCPNCGGKGFVPKGLETVGVMALIRDRERRELHENVIGIAETPDQREWAALCCADIDRLFRLIAKLEH